MPLEREQTSPEEHDSLIYDNRALMEMRRFNLHNPLSPSMQSQGAFCAHPVGPGDRYRWRVPHGEITVTASVIAVIYHRKQDTFAGTVTWRLAETKEGLKIKSKRVDLLNADAPLDSIMMYI